MTYRVDDIMGIIGRWSALERCEWVYFAERDGLVKIGFSRNPVQRAKGLSARLMAVMPGTLCMERRMHQLFAAYRVHGEWFRPGLDLVSFVEALRGEGVGLPGEYAADEAARREAQEIADEARAAAVDNARALTVADTRETAGQWPPPIPGDRVAAELIAAVLGEAPYAIEVAAAAAEGAA